ncbi:MAG: integron integrase, partial [Candidatus Rokuibacteriota bacterium]
MELPTALVRKYPNAGRHHLHESVVQRAVKHAVRRAGIVKR